MLSDQEFLCYFKFKFKFANNNLLNEWKMLPRCMLIFMLFVDFIYLGVWTCIIQSIIEQQHHQSFNN